MITQKDNMFTVLKSYFGYTNVMQTPKVKKIVISTGVGKFLKDKKRQEFIANRLIKITGQKPASRIAKKSIASFKVREGDISGFQVTLRGERMNNFLQKLIHIVLPRSRDFRGLKKESIDDMGNYTIGLPDHTVFPETSDEDLKDVFGLAVTIVTTAKSKNEAEAFLREIGLPLRK